MFAASAQFLLNNLLNRICLLRFCKRNKLKISKTHFFQMAARIYYCIGRIFFDKLVFSGKVAPNLVILGYHPRFSHSTVQTLYRWKALITNKLFRNSGTPVYYQCRL
jgi:hypothetical protein